MISKLDDSHLFHFAVFSEEKPCFGTLYKLQPNWSDLHYCKFSGLDSSIRAFFVRHLNLICILSPIKNGYLQNRLNLFIEVAGNGPCSKGKVGLRAATNQPIRVTYCR